MLEAIAYGIGVILLVLFIFFAVTDAGALIGLLFLPIIRWSQRIFFGIDKPKAGPEALLGKVGRIRSDFATQEPGKSAEGYVVIDGESWKARSFAPEEQLLTGRAVTVAEREGLELVVEPCNESG